MKTLKTLLTLSYIILAFSLDAGAEDISSNTGNKNDVKQARFMLEDKTSNIAEIKIKNTDKDVDFSWSVLSKNSPANGALPLIGKGSGKPYYQFEDGLPHPYYLSNKAKF